MAMFSILARLGKVTWLTPALDLAPVLLSYTHICQSKKWIPDNNLSNPCHGGKTKCPEHQLNNHVINEYQYSDHWSVDLPVLLLLCPAAISLCTWHCWAWHWLGFLWGQGRGPLTDWPGHSGWVRPIHALLQRIDIVTNTIIYCLFNHCTTIVLNIVIITVTDNNQL